LKELQNILKDKERKQYDFKKKAAFFIPFKKGPELPDHRLDDYVSIMIEAAIEHKAERVALARLAKKQIKKDQVKETVMNETEAMKNSKKDENGTTELQRRAKAETALRLSHQLFFDGEKIVRDERDKIIKALQNEIFDPDKRGLLKAKKEIIESAIGVSYDMSERSGKVIIGKGTFESIRNEIAKKIKSGDFLDDQKKNSADIMCKYHEFFCHIVEDKLESRLKEKTDNLFIYRLKWLADKFKLKVNKTRLKMTASKFEIKEKTHEVSENFKEQAKRFKYFGATCA